tara:strand:- start:989 stop:1507 length:519 start_codon:yes stop_codon:yes gene_type:complete
VQIHAGNLKGRRIKTVKNAPYRPTTALARKSLFDTLGNIEGKTFLDLFSGTGIIGFEACSRGVRHVMFVEKSVRANALLKINFALLGISDDRCQILKDDVFRFLKEDKKFDIIFADPPYNSTNLDPIIDQSIGMLHNNGMFVLESVQQQFSNPPFRVREFGDTQLNFWKNES